MELRLRNPWLYPNTEAGGFRAMEDAAAVMGAGALAARAAIRAEHAAWSDATFGRPPAIGPLGPLKHLAKEALEAAAAPHALEEWADLQFLLWDAQRRAGITDDQVVAAMRQKLAVNKARHWPAPQDGEPREHVKPAGGADDAE
ncbi:dATP/dGTP pyrophosphohydrolase domain-containing protein [Pseudoroseomonas cervicalis]|uniref:dATP/dGTP pyrophosphohydrolase domain-containing protein n=1 Tax=Teichococcus cervicalis TaxID=204525 RepID=UPI001FDF9C3D|nr:dATP/dGTP pyrophosphohydrolase domain-containing protein [Pseudoroseomonas cervicalis]